MSTTPVPVRFQIQSADDFGQAQARLSEIQRTGETEAGIVFELASGTYARPFSLAAPDVPVDITIRGQGEVWFEGESISLVGERIAVANIGFRGAWSQGTPLFVQAKAAIDLSDVSFDHVAVGRRRAIDTASSLPRRPGGKRVQARGRMPARLSYLVHLDTRGPAAITVRDLHILDSTLVGHALIGIETRPKSPVELERVVVARTTADAILRAAPAGAIRFRDSLLQVPPAGVLVLDDIGGDPLTFDDSRIVVDDPDHLAVGRDAQLEHTAVWGRHTTAAGWRTNGEAIDEALSGSVDPRQAWPQL